MKLDQIKKHAETLRSTKVGMSNYAQVFNDTLVLIREIADQLEAVKQSLDVLMAALRQKADDTPGGNTPRTNN